jgi:hypothetical protein
MRYFAHGITLIRRYVSVYVQRNGCAGLP